MNRIAILLLCVALLPACRSQQTVPVSKPEVKSLPEERVQELFGRIQKDEKIDLNLIYQALIGSQTALRADAARYLGTHGDETSVSHLIDALGDDSFHVGGDYIKPGMETTRYWANDSLKKLTGQDFGFVWNDPKKKREAAISRWRAWYSRQHREGTL